MKRFLAMTLALLMLASMMTACGGGEQQTGRGQGGAAKDTVTVMAETITETLNPLSASVMDAWVKSALFDRLVRFDENGNIQPMLAESWEEDGLTITLKLRQGVKSHDGEEINADDVIFSLDTLFAVPNYYYLATYMSSWEKVDEYTVRIEKVAAYCKTLEILATYCPIVSKEAFESLGEEEFAKAPVGSGPYTLVQHGNDNVITLEANEDYWGGKPAYKNLVVKPPMDMATAVMALQNGEQDIITSPPSAQWSVIESDSSLVLDTAPGWSAMTLCFMNNMTADQNLRKAIYHGINRQSIIMVATEGTAVEAKDIYSELTMGELAGAFDVPGYDVELAKEYLDKSDYVAGTPLLLTVSSADEVAIAQSIQNDMNQIGVTIEIKQVDSNTVVSMLTNGELDMWLSSMGGATVAMIDMLLYWESANPMWGPQIAHDAEYDELCTQMRVETDSAKLKELARRAMEIQYDLCNHLSLYETLFSVAYNKAVAGPNATSVAAGVYYPQDLRPAQ